MENYEEKLKDIQDQINKDLEDYQIIDLNDPYVRAVIDYNFGFRKEKPINPKSIDEGPYYSKQKILDLLNEELASIENSIDSEFYGGAWYECNRLIGLVEKL